MELPELPVEVGISRAGSVSLIILFSIQFLEFEMSNTKMCVVQHHRTVECACAVSIIVLVSLLFLKCNRHQKSSQCTYAA